MPASRPARSPAQKDGFYAEFAAVDAVQAWPIPTQLTPTQAGALPIDAGTALRGLKDILGLEQGETLPIFGAGGGIGHLALQLAQRLGARVLAVASSEDGVALAQRLGADAIVEGHTRDVRAAASEFAPHGLDTALVTAGGGAAEHAHGAMRTGGRVAYPKWCAQTCPRRMPRTGRRRGDGAVLPPSGCGRSCAYTGRARATGFWTWPPRQPIWLWVS
jgi:NADPH2:quinone reductase